MSSSVPETPETSFKDRFFDHFKQETSTLQEQIDNLSKISSTGTARLDAVNQSLASITKLQREVSDASSQLPAHNQKSYSDQLKQLSENLQKSRGAFAPRHKFSFKNVNKVPSAAPSPAPTVSTSQPPAETPEEPQDKGKYNATLRSSTDKLIRRPSFTNATSINIFSHEGLHITIPPSAKNAITTSTIHNITNCFIDISFLFSSPSSSFATMNITEISESLLVAGRVKGALHVTNMRNSTIVAATGQLRMHQCENVSVYLRCSSDPIIEHCKKVRFAPLPQLFLQGGDNEVEGLNRWNKVQDFQWIKAEHSPNWCEISFDDRVGDEVWRNVVSGDEVGGAEETLQTVNGGKA
ncbi:TBCC-domain-containing protein [Venturia nashicola]|uniref:TBCC-domain-containing protein n=1 Tax=Venturia nashicola TaxID=86259 RepID=A0A4Z1P2B9_9PEZI|nr:TBCC-domain-containing protein [Venturia nashicola]TLD20239.1 TBCC-domain-containing protein [Venturia nashicola]